MKRRFEARTISSQLRMTLEMIVLRVDPTFEAKGHLFPRGPPTPAVEFGRDPGTAPLHVLPLAKVPLQRIPQYGEVEVPASISIINVLLSSINNNNNNNFEIIKINKLINKASSAPDASPCAQTGNA